MLGISLIEKVMHRKGSPQQLTSTSVTSPYRGDQFLHVEGVEVLGISLTEKVMHRKGSPQQ